MSGYGKSTAAGLDTPRGDHWMAKAICRDEDPETWYPVGNSGPALALTAKAVAICGRCPVQLACLLDAVRHPAMDQHGIAGGLTADQRTYFVKPCTNGHPRTAETVAFEGGMPYCVPCRRRYTADWWASNGAELASEIEDALRPQPASVPTCSVGHPLTGSNAFGPNGNRCRTCTGDKSRAAYLRKLGWQQQMAEVAS